MMNTWSGMLVTKPTVESTILDPANQWNQLLLNWYRNRSVEKRKLCYTTFIGDGDSKSFQQVREMDPYARSIIEREHIKQRKRSYIRKANLDRRMRRQELGRECRERELLKREGGHSYKSSSFGSETFSERIIKRPSRNKKTSDKTNNHNIKYQNDNGQR